MSTMPGAATNIQGSTGALPAPGTVVDGKAGTTNPFLGNNYFSIPGSTSSSTTNTNPFAPFSFGNADLTKQLTSIFGPIGTAYGNFLSSGGGYDSQTLTALINQLQPQISSDIATLGASAGAAGTRFGSGYELGLGDYLSQVNANEQAMAANLYQQSIQNQLGVLGGLTSDIFEQRNQPGFGSAFLTSLLSSAAGGIGNILFGGKGGYGGSGGNTGGILGTLISKIPGLGGSTSGSNTGITLGGTGDLPPLTPVPTFPGGATSGGGGGLGGFDITAGLTPPTFPGGIYNEGNYLASLPGLAGLVGLQGLGFTGQTGSNILGDSGGGTFGGGNIPFMA